MNPPRNFRASQSKRSSDSPGQSTATAAPAHAVAGSLAIDGSLTIARNEGESESLSVTHGFEPGSGLVTGLRIHGDLILGRTPSPESASACGFLTVAGGASGSAPPALVVDGAIQSPPRASMLFVLRGSASAGMIALWSGHLLGDGRLSLHEGSCSVRPDAGARKPSASASCTSDSLASAISHGAGAIGAFLGPNLLLEAYGCDAVPPSNANRRLPHAAEYGAIEFGMGVVMRRSTIRLRVGPRARDGRANDRVVCHGTLHLGGSRLTVSSAFLQLPIELAAGDAFVLIEAGSICGELERADLPAPPKGLRFALERTNTAITLRVRTA